MWIWKTVSEIKPENLKNQIKHCMTLNSSLMILYVLKLLMQKTSYEVWLTQVD